MYFPFAPELRRCPKAVVLESDLGPDVYRWLEWWSRWERHGVLPYPGDLGDQPSWLADGLEAIADAVADERARRADVEAREAREAWAKIGKG